jgi:hypothetical protein
MRPYNNSLYEIHEFRYKLTNMHSDPCLIEFSTQCRKTQPKLQNPSGNHTVTHARTTMYLAHPLPKIHFQIHHLPPCPRPRPLNPHKFPSLITNPENYTATHSHPSITIHTRLIPQPQPGQSIAPPSPSPSPNKNDHHPITAFPAALKTSCAISQPSTRAATTSVQETSQGCHGGWLMDKSPMCCSPPSHGRIESMVEA